MGGEQLLLGSKTYHQIILMVQKTCATWNIMKPSWKIGIFSISTWFSHQISEPSTVESFFRATPQEAAARTSWPCRPSLVLCKVWTKGAVQPAWVLQRPAISKEKSTSKLESWTCQRFINIWLQLFFLNLTVRCGCTYWLIWRQWRETICRMCDIYYQVDLWIWCYQKQSLGTLPETNSQSTWK